MQRAEVFGGFLLEALGSHQQRSHGRQFLLVLRDDIDTLDVPRENHVTVGFVLLLLSRESPLQPQFLDRERPKLLRRQP